MEEGSIATSLHSVNKKVEDAKLRSKRVRIKPSFKFYA